MIVADSSALIAVLESEPDASRFEDAIAAADRCIMSAVNAHETATVLRFRRPAVGKFWLFLADAEIEVIPFDEAMGA